MDTNRCVWKRRRSGLRDRRPSQAYSYGALCVSPEVVIREPIYIILHIIFYVPIISIHAHTHTYIIFNAILLLYIIYYVCTMFSYQATNPTAFQVADTGQYRCRSWSHQKVTLYNLYIAAVHQYAIIKPTPGV